MKNNRKTIVVLICVVCVAVFLTAFVPVAHANSAEPPGLTVVVPFPPDDLELSVAFADGSMTNAVRLQKERKAWEAYYRFYYWMDPSLNYGSLEGATLIAKSSKKTFECQLPESVTKKYNSLVTLDFNSESITSGQMKGRSAALVSMRVVLTLLIEGFIFFLFGYRKRVSWVTFIIVNLVTQGALNITLSSSAFDSYLYLSLLFYEFFIFIAEIIVFAIVLKERKRSRAVVYALTANMASLILGGFLIAFLPV